MMNNTKNIIQEKLPKIYSKELVDILDFLHNSSLTAKPLSKFTKARIRLNLKSNLFLLSPQF
jgi:hypothetical protein